MYLRLFLRTFALLVYINICIYPLAAKAQFIPPPRPTTPHYLCAENRPLKSILLERWAAHEFPLKIYLPTPHQLSATPELHRQAVEKALLSWREVWPQLSYVFVSQPVKNGIEVIWHTHVVHDKRTMWGNAYYPIYYRDAQKKVLHWSKINLAVKSHIGSGLHRDQVINLSFREMRDLAIHEIGHALGLPHSDDPNDVMGSGYNAFLHTELDMRNISPRDVRTLNFLYQLSYRTQTHPCPQNNQVLK